MKIENLKKPLLMWTMTKVVNIHRPQTLNLKVKLKPQCLLIEVDVLNAKFWYETPYVFYYCPKKCCRMNNNMNYYERKRRRRKEKSVSYF